MKILKKILGKTARVTARFLLSLPQVALVFKKISAENPRIDRLLRRMLVLGTRTVALERSTNELTNSELRAYIDLKEASQRQKIKSA